MKGDINHPQCFQNVIQKISIILLNSNRRNPKYSAMLSILSDPAYQSPECSAKTSAADYK